MVRPEDIQITARKAGDRGIEGSVVISSFLGSLRRTQVRLDDDTIISVQHDVSERHEPGDSVTVTFRGAPVSVLAKS